MKDFLNRPTSDAELEKVAKLTKLKRFHGVYPIDKIPLKLKKGYYIYNYLPENTSGSHWALIRFKTHGKDEAFTFSSFGDPPPKRVLEILEVNGVENLKYNTLQVQDFSSAMCGLFCIAFCLLSENGESDLDICDQIFMHEDPEQRKNNHILLNLLFNKYYNDAGILEA